MKLFSEVWLSYQRAVCNASRAENRVYKRVLKDIRKKLLANVAKGFCWISGSGMSEIRGFEKLNYHSKMQVYRKVVQYLKDEGFYVEHNSLKDTDIYYLVVSLVHANDKKDYQQTPS